jgi:hypothetical protein
VAPDAAIEHVRTWQRGVLPRAHLHGASGRTRIASIHAFYLPFWAFTVKLPVRSAAADLPVLLVYSGCSIPRPMTDVIQKEVDVSACEPFQPSMLEIGMQVDARGFR